MADDQGAVTAPPPGHLQHIDWERAIHNHQSEEKLVAFLEEYPADLRRNVAEIQQALQSQDDDTRLEKLREAAQQVMGSSSYIAANQLNERARALVEAIDLEFDKDEPGTTNSLANKTVQEAMELEKEILSLSADAKAQPGSQGQQQQCCSIQ